MREDGGVRTEQIWRGPLWTVLIVGVRSGTLFGLLQLATGMQWERSLLVGLMFGVIFGVVMAVVRWSRWKTARRLSSSDRRVVARSISKGEPVNDRRLAQAVVEYAQVVRDTHDHERRYGWTLWIWATLTLILAVAETASGTTREATVLWGLVVFWIIFIATKQRRDRKTILRTARAEQAARKLLDSA
jgi:xanthine/uracil permease